LTSVSISAEGLGKKYGDTWGLKKSTFNIKSGELAVLVGPNGVGKTTTAVNLAHGLVLEGKRVLLVDLDPQGQCATILGLKPESGAFNLLVAEQSLGQVTKLTDRENLLVLQQSHSFRIS
jgi:ABC-type multidrug transport system ATPase subunit